MRYPIVTVLLYSLSGCNCHDSPRASPAPSASEHLATAPNRTRPDTKATTATPWGSATRPAPLASASAVGGPPEVREYVTDGSMGTLSMRTTMGGSEHFAIDVVGANAHTCELEGDVVAGIARLDDDGDSKATCVVHFLRKEGGFEIKVDDREPCSRYCGVRAWFEGTYRPRSPACTPAKVDADRKAFKQMYQKEDYRSAYQRLAFVLEKCEKTLDRFDEMWVRNDLALTLHKLERDSECRAMLDPLRDWALQSDEDIASVEPTFADVNRKIAKATRFNLELCKAQ